MANYVQEIVRSTKNRRVEFMNMNKRLRNGVVFSSSSSFNPQNHAKEKFMSWYRLLTLPRYIQNLHTQKHSTVLGLLLILWIYELQWTAFSKSYKKFINSSINWKVQVIRFKPWIFSPLGYCFTWLLSAVKSWLAQFYNMHPRLFCFFGPFNGGSIIILPTNFVPSDLLWLAPGRNFWPTCFYMFVWFDHENA